LLILVKARDVCPTCCYYLRHRLLASIDLIQPQVMNLPGIVLVLDEGKSAKDAY
jgi:hypothetical protein